MRGGADNYLFTGLTVVVILHQVLTTNRVTNDTIGGAICAYLMFSLMYAFVFAMIEICYPGSFATQGKEVHLQPGQFYHQHDISKSYLL
jgi:hypothetical protein